MRKEQDLGSNWGPVGAGEWDWAGQPRESHLQQLSPGLLAWPELAPAPQPPSPGACCLVPRRATVVAAWG